MRALTPSLEAAQHSASAAPYVRVRVRDYDLGVPRLRWRRWYMGSEAAGPCVAAVPADGSLLRARIDVATGTLYHSYVAAPNASSTYSTWISLGTVAATSRLALAAAGTRALLVTVRIDGVTVEVRESTDSGASFGTSSLLTTAAGTVTAVACTSQADGSAAVFYGVAGVVYAITRTGTGSWLSPSSWTPTLATINGLVATFDLDHQLLVSGATSASVPGVWSTTYGAGGAAPPDIWLPLVEVATASSGIGMSYLATGVAVAGVPRATIVETYTDASVSSRAHLVTALADTTFADQQWRDPRPLEVADAHGAGLASADGDAWLVASDGVWHASVNLEVSDLTEDVLEVDLQQAREHGRLRLVLRGDDGRHQQANAPIAPVGGELLVDPGYRTPVGPEVSEGLRFRITFVRRRFGHGAATVEIEAVDAWGILDAWTASRQLVWSAGVTSVASIVAQLVTRVGLRLVSSGASTESALLQPAFTVRAGEHAALALRRLLAMVPDQVVVRGNELLLHEPVTSDATTYVLGSEHAITSLRVDEDASGPGWVRVFGNGVFAEAIDTDSARAGAPTIVVVNDNLDVQARAEARAATTLRRAALAAQRGELVAPPNAAQELGDVIEISAASLGLARARYRVASLRLRLTRGGPRPTYEMTLALSAV